ncbi:MAG: hypothetical protein HN982_04690 [Candidatus Marinimicrobia bacterium]|nr:hypothetical protein [Candidatus Neomarinimicrobiota bacterium]
MTISPVNPGRGIRLMLEAKMKDFGKIMVSVFTKDLRMDSPSTSGEFIRWAENNSNA